MGENARGLSPFLLFPLLLLFACDQQALEPEISPPLPVFSTIPLTRYTALDLGTLGGGFSIANDINDLGQVVGVAAVPSGDLHAFLWYEGGMHDLGTLGGTRSSAYAINNSGQIAGWSSLEEGGQHAFLWEDGEMRDLGPIGSLSFALGINELGQVVGSADNTGMVWDGDATTPLETPVGDHTTGFAINSTGVVAGFLSSGTDRWAVRWVDGTLEDQWTLGGNFGEARAINDAEQIAGWSKDGDGVDHAFLWEEGSVEDLAIPGEDRSGAEGINNRGQIVGWSQSGTVYSPVVWTAGTPTVLPSLGVGASDAGAGINESGHIAGVSVLLTGERHATLWRPLVPAEVFDLIGMVEELCEKGVPNNGQCNSLLNKLLIATAMLNDEKTGPALHKIRSFINEVEALMKPEHNAVLTGEQGQPLVDAANGVIADLGG